MSKKANYQNQNRKKAYKHFGLTMGNAQDLVLHHKDPDLIVKDIERYNEWRPEDLVVLTRKEHARLHHKGTKRPDWVGKKISQARKGKPIGGKWYKNESIDVNIYVLPNCDVPDGFILGRILKPESIAKMAESKKGSVPWNKGKHNIYSEEVLAKMRANRLGVRPNNTRKVAQYDLDGELIKIWDAIVDIQRELGFNKNKIGLTCRGKRYKTYKGYIWKYKD